MTIGEAILRADVLSANSFEEHEKLAWLSAVDGQIYEEIVMTHAGAAPWHPYTVDTDRTTPLLAAHPYDDLYIAWLEMKYDYYNGDTARYNNAAALFAARYDEFAKYYNRTHMPMGTRFRYFGGEDGGRRGGKRLIGRRGEEIADPLSE